MRRRFVFASIGFVLAVLAVSMVFGTGIVDVSKFSLGVFFGAQPAQGGTTVFVDPEAVIKDYLNDPGYQIGDKFTVHVNVSDVTDLFSWQVNLTWNPAVLNFSRVKEYGSFLRATSSPNGTSGWIERDPTRNVTVASIDYDAGFGGVAETILGDYLGISGGGRLVSVEFEVLAYGWSNITVSSVGNLATTLLNSAGGSISFSVVDGFFMNKLTGDANGDVPYVVNSLDLGTLNGHWAPSEGTPGWSLGYDRATDCNDDGFINSLDLGVVNGNWGRHYP